MGARSVLVIAVIATLIVTAGCAVSSERFYSQRDSLGAVSLCRTYKSAIQRGEPQLARDVEAELRMRLTTEVSQCNEIISESNAAAVVGVIAAAVLVAAVAEGGGSSGSSNTTASSSDYDWDWDQFYNEYGTLIWRCRGIQTGQFAEDTKCVSDLKTDLRWRSKSADMK
jgi:hypothetical protein